MDLLSQALDVFFHLDRHLNQWVAACGGWAYLLLFAVVFCETGLVVTPFLPGDSLLFALGALTASEGAALKLFPLMGLLIAAGVAGDAVNYAAGKYAGPRVFTSERSRLLNRGHLLRAQAFYERHGGKAIFLARFVPIVRTFAPFVAGIGRMRYGRFAFFNVSGAVAWVAGFLLAGHAFGEVPAVKRNFHLIILAIIAISCVPVAVEFLKARREGKVQ